MTTTTKKALHTPGPWQAEWSTQTSSVIGGQSVIGPKQGWHVFSPDTVDFEGCVCELQDDGDNERVEANARLIAAAPELLAALIDLIADAERMDKRLLIGQPDPGCEKGTIVRARAAVAKAAT